MFVSLGIRRRQWVRVFRRVTGGRGGGGRRTGTRGGGLGIGGAGREPAMVGSILYQEYAQLGDAITGSNMMTARVFKIANSPERNPTK